MAYIFYFLLNQAAFKALSWAIFIAYYIYWNEFVLLEAKFLGFFLLYSSP